MIHCYICTMQNEKSAKGFICGAVSSAAFGLIPLFSLPLMQAGLSFESILFYRLAVSALFIGCYMLVRRLDFSISIKEFAALFFLSTLYSATALFLFSGYMYISSGVATTIHYLYPVLVTSFMVIFFKEQSSVWIAVAITLAIAGVGLLGWGDGGAEVNLKGMAIVLVSVATYALYIVGVNKSIVKDLNGLKVTFYVLLLGSVFFLINAVLKGGVQPVSGGQSIANVIFLALIPTILSNVTLVYSIKFIGSTMTSVLGAMEPLTAVLVGVMVFGESFTLNVALGVLLILVAVTLVVLSKDLQKRIRESRVNVNK